MRGFATKLTAGFAVTGAALMISLGVAGNAAAAEPFAAGSVGAGSLAVDGPCSTSFGPLGVTIVVPCE